MNDYTTKVCTRCKQEKPSTGFYKNARSKDGLQDWCIQCRKEHYRSDEPKKHFAVRVKDGMKQCSCCEEWFPQTDEHFYKSNNRKDGLYPECKTCKQNKDVQTARARGVNPKAETLKDGKRKCPRCQQWKDWTLEYFTKSTNYPGGLSNVCRDCTRAKGQEASRKKGMLPRAVQIIDGKKQCTKCKQWYPANNEYFGISKRMDNGLQSWCRDCLNKQRRSKSNEYHVTDHEYRARKRKLPHDFKLRDWQFALDYFGNRCAACGKSADFWTIIAKDHWVALDDDRENNPGTVPSNIIPLCHSKKDGLNGCNNSKKNRDAIEWLNDRFGDKKAKQIHRKILEFFDKVRKP